MAQIVLKAYMGNAYYRGNIYLFVLCFNIAFLRIVYHMLPVSLDCPFFVTLSVFSFI